MTECAQTENKMPTRHPCGGGAPPRVHVDLTEQDGLDLATATPDGNGAVAIDNEHLRNNAVVASTSSAKQEEFRKSQSENGDGNQQTNGKSAGKPQNGQKPVELRERIGMPAGIPARGPSVVYRCRVLHRADSSFLVVSCPNASYVRAVLNHDIVKGARQDDRMLFVIHLSPDDVVQLPAYAPLLAIKAKHILLGCGRHDRKLEGAGGLQHRKIAERSVQLNFVAPQAFPLHHALRNSDHHPDATDVEVFGRTCGDNQTPGKPLLKAVLLPVSARGIDVSAVHPPVDIAAIREDMKERVAEAGLDGERARIVADLAAAHGLPGTDEGVEKSLTTSNEPELHVTSPNGVSAAKVMPEKQLQQSRGTRLSPTKRKRPRVETPTTPPGIFRWPLPPPPPPPPLPISPMHQPMTYRQNGHVPVPPPRVPLFSGGGFAGAEVFFLGTGCAAPSKNRGCSGILVRIPQSGLVRPGSVAAGEPVRLLIDAGEGTLGHLERQFGRDGALREIEGLDCVWISHKHADHHTGLFRLLAEHTRAMTAREARVSAMNPNLSTGNRTQPLTVVAPNDVLMFLGTCRRASGESVTYRPINCKTLIRPAPWRGGANAGSTRNNRNGNVLERYGATALLAGMASVPVLHCKEAYGLIFQPWQAGAKLVYSGDTRPCDRLVAAGAGAALLIHEATFDDSKQKDAVSKRHSTTSEALDVGRRMRAEEVVLTHFSQRYPRVPVLEPENTQRFCVAFDGMVLNTATCAVLPAAASLLSQVLERKAEEENDEEEDIAEDGGLV